MKHLISLLEVGYEGIQYLNNRINDGELSYSDITLLDNFEELFSKICGVINQNSNVLNRVNDITNNLLYYIEQLKINAEKNQITFFYDFRFHFCSLFYILEYEIAYIVEKYVKKEDYPHLYQDEKKVDHNEILKKGENCRFKVSVILLAYNNLKFTRDCVESILDNSKDVDYELILVDNGSTDGTKEYFNSIKGAKVISLKYNLHVVKGFNIGLMAAEGKYCAAVCNDFIFTSNWLNNLIKCIESDPKIGYVSPGATFISNMQQISIPFTTKDEFQCKAKEYNLSNPQKWEERVVLLPNVLFCPTALIEAIGYYDTRYYRGEFLDDDISFRIRRAGYKLIYCADTVTHHYGSLTTTSDHQKNSMEEGRKTFIEKYGFDAWDDARVNSAYFSVNFNFSCPKKILGIDVKCGATILQIKNKIWSTYGVKPSVYTITTNKKYYIDLCSISERAFFTESLSSWPEGLSSQVDLVYIETPIDCCSDNIDIIFKNLSKVMSQNGQLILMVNNNYSIESLYAALNSSSILHNRKIFIQNDFCLQAEIYGFYVSSITNLSIPRSTTNNDIAENLARHIASGKESGSKQVEKILKTSYQLYQFIYR